MTVVSIPRGRAANAKANFDPPDSLTPDPADSGLSAMTERAAIARTATLEAANRELETFAHRVAHELRAPLRAIDGFARLLLTEPDEGWGETERGYLARIVASGQRMVELIDALLALSRIDRAPISTCVIDMHRLISEIVGELRAQEPSRNVLATIDALPCIRADQVLLRQALENLLANAFKYTRRRQFARIHVGSYEENGEVVFFVRDNGAGFDVRHADKMFGMFERLHGAAQFEGNGVGLALVKRIIDSHGGRIWAEGEPDAGATFYVTIPQDRGL